MIFQPSTATEVYPPPEWAVAYLNKLKAVIGCELEIKLYTASRDVFEGKTIGITKNPNAYVVSTVPPMIIMNETLTDGDPARNLLCHEFMHVLHLDMDKICVNALNDGDLAEYARKMEDFVHIISRLMRIVDHFDIVWVDESSAQKNKKSNEMT